GVWFSLPVSASSLAVADSLLCAAASRSFPPRARPALANRLRETPHPISSAMSSRLTNALWLPRQTAWHLLPDCSGNSASLRSPDHSTLASLHTFPDSPIPANPPSLSHSRGH